MNDDDFELDIEQDPVFITSQVRVGEVVTEKMFNAFQSLVSKLDEMENLAVDDFHRGRESAFLEIGGEELLTSIKLKDEERIAKIVQKHMEKIFPKEQRIKH